MDRLKNYMPNSLSSKLHHRWFVKLAKNNSLGGGNSSYLFEIAEHW